MVQIAFHSRNWVNHNKFLNFAMFWPDFLFLNHALLKTISEPAVGTSEWEIHGSLTNASTYNWCKLRSIKKLGQPE